MLVCFLRLIIDWFMFCLQVKDFIKSRLWRLVKQLATYLSGLDEWYPYDVSMNIIRNSHYPRIHEDCMPNEVDVHTYITFINVSNWGHL